MAAFERHSLLPATEKEAGLRRIGYYQWKGQTREIANWNILDWFIRVARNRTPLREMAESEVDLLRLEYRALQQERLDYTENVVTVEALEKFRTRVRNHLDALADHRWTEFGPFTLKRIISRQEPGPNGRPRYACTHVEPGEGEGLLYLLSNLVESVQQAVLRCPRPRCSQVFLQPRRDALYCSRACQAAAHADKQRKDATAKRERRSSERGKPKSSKRTQTRRTSRRGDR
jgi:hypothetical protein